MSIKAAVSAVALASAMLIAPAFAQDAAMEMTIGGNPVAEQDQAAVQARCDDLALAKDTQSLTQSDSSDDQATGDSSDASSADATIVDAPADDSESATTIDLSIITLDECETGGWLSSAM